MREGARRLFFSLFFSFSQKCRPKIRSGNERKNFVKLDLFQTTTKKEGSSPEFLEFFNKRQTRTRRTTKRQTRPKRCEKKAETQKPNRNKIEIKNAKRVVFLNFLILAHVFKTQHTYLQTMFAATQQIASVAGLKATKVQVRVSIVSDLCRSSSLLLLLLDSWNG